MTAPPSPPRRSRPPPLPDALVLLMRGIAVRPARITGLVLVGAVVLKLVLFDLVTLDGIARAAAFLGAGLVLLAAGVW